MWRRLREDDWPALPELMGDGAAAWCVGCLEGACLSILGYIGAWVLVPVLFVATLTAMSGLLSHTVTDVIGFLVYVPVLALWAPFWWVVHFLCFASGPAVRNGFSLSAPIRRFRR